MIFKFFIDKIIVCELKTKKYNTKLLDSHSLRTVVLSADDLSPRGHNVGFSELVLGSRVVVNFLRMYLHYNNKIESISPRFNYDCFHLLIYLL